MDSNTEKSEMPKFDGTNSFATWKQRMIDYMICKNMDDEIKRAAVANPLKVTVKAMAMIRCHLSDTVMKKVRHCKSVGQIFETLEKIYTVSSASRRYLIMSKLNKLKMANDFEKHLTEFETLIEEMQAAGKELDDADRICYFLPTLSPSLNQVKAVVEANMNQLMFHDAVMKIRDSVNQQEVAKAGKVEASVLHVKVKKMQVRAKCYNCGRVGHLKRDCYAKQKLMRQEHNQRFKVVRQVPKENRRPNKPAQKKVEKPAEKPQVNVATAQLEESGFVYMVSQKPHLNSFIIDSGATHHIVVNASLTNGFQQLENPIQFGSFDKDACLAAISKGTVNIRGDDGRVISFKDVLYVPNGSSNILSVRELQKSGIRVIFEEGNDCRVTLEINGTTWMRQSIENGLNIIFDIEQASVNKVNSRCKDFKLWHQRMGHMSDQKFNHILSKNLVEDPELIEGMVPSSELCEPCITAKQTRLPFNNVKDKSSISRPLQAISSDVCGPITPMTHSKKSYFVTFIDHFTHYTIVYLMREKSEVLIHFKDYVAKAEAIFNSKVQTLYCDNGGEYVSHSMQDYCSEKGISYHLTVPRTPEQNGVAERLNRTLTEKARSLLFTSKLSKKFWGDAILTACYLTNITPTRALSSNKTPFELWHNKKPLLKYLRVFGSTAFVLDKTNKGKFDSRSRKGILVGYHPNGYKVWDVSKSSVEIARDVVFDEREFLNSRPEDSNDLSEHQCELEFWSVKPPASSGIPLDTGSGRVSCDIISDAATNTNPAERIEAENENSLAYDTDLHASPERLQDIITNDVSEVPTSKDNIDCRTNAVPSTSATSRTATFSGSRKRGSGDDGETVQRKSSRLTNSTYLQDKYDDFVLRAHMQLEPPKSFKEVDTRDDKAAWFSAVEEELKSLEKNKTWTLVPRPPGRNIVGNRWVFNIKLDEHGNPQRYKARLVAKGFSQQFSIDYNETFAPVANIRNFRFLLAFANQHKLQVHHMDVKTAFLNGDLKEDIYMELPCGLDNESNKGLICKLNKSLYGLKQAARCWFEKLDGELKLIGFKESLADPCVYFIKGNSVQEDIYIVLYVDDLVIITGDMEKLAYIKGVLMKKFEMVDLNEIKLFLGIRITRTADTICFDQSAYTKSVLTKFRMENSKPVATPMEAKLDHVALSEDNVNCEAPIRSAIGSLMYLMLSTRPDISVAVNIISQYTNKKNDYLWKCIKRVFQYLNGTSDFKLTYERCPGSELIVGFVDADWGGQSGTDRKSTTGFLFKVHDKSLISWCTRRQRSVATSSTEAEYMALCEAVKEAISLRQFAKSLELDISTPTLMYEDNQGCIAIANNATCNSRTKHIDIAYHKIRDEIKNNQVALKYIPTSKQEADILTKPLTGPTFVNLRNSIFNSFKNA